MPSLEVYKRTMNSHLNNLGNYRKQSSDTVIECTWEGDIASKKAYIYDYAHDDYDAYGNSKCRGMSYQNTRKYPIDIKFIIDSYDDIEKKKSSYRIMFRPSQKLSFENTDDMYYFETDYRNKYDVEFPVGLYIDIPDDAGVYHKWLIVEKEFANQFPVYIILECNYYFHWVSTVGANRIKRKMWGVRRDSNVSSALDGGEIQTTTKTVKYFYLPLNKICEELTYTYVYDGESNTRLAISALINKPTIWKVCGIDCSNQFGIMAISVVQDLWNDTIDYIDESEIANGDLYAIYADGKLNASVPVSTLPSIIIDVKYGNITIDGAYRTFTCKVFDGETDVTDDYLDYQFGWSAQIINQYDFISGSDTVFDDSNLLWKFDDNAKNSAALKVINDKRFIGATMRIVCFMTYNNEAISGSVDVVLR